MKTLKLPFKNTVSEAESVYLESDGNYTIIHKKSSPRKVVATSRLCYIQNSLDAINFLRINRGKVINLNYLKTTLEKKDSIEFTFGTGEQFTSSRRRTVDFLNAI